MTSRASRSVATPAVVVLAAASFLGACGAPEEKDDVVYCVDESNETVDPDRCDDSTGTTSNGIFYYMMGRYNSGLPIGSQLNPSQSTARFRSTDTAARTKYGFSPSGKIATGKSAGFGTGSGKSGGFGGSKSGGSGGGAKGGSGGS